MFMDRPKVTDNIHFMLDEIDEVQFAEVAHRYNLIEEAGKKYLADVPHISSSNAAKEQTYTQSTDYFFETLEYHRSPYVQAFNGLALQLLDGFKLKDVVDAGCAYGISGLTFATQHTPTTFHDFEGKGLDFLRFCRDSTDLKPYVNIVPYGEPVKRHGMCLAFDVLEHTGNHLAALRWFKELGDMVCMCYPTRVPRLPAYEQYGLDEWVDDEAIMWTIQRRYQVVYSTFRYDMRMIVFC